MCYEALSEKNFNIEADLQNGIFEIHKTNPVSKRLTKKQFNLHCKNYLK
jgi:hypothetical protein